MAFDVEALNTEKELLRWNVSSSGSTERRCDESSDEGEGGTLKARSNIIALRQGLYRLSLAFFCLPLPKVTIFVNASPAIFLPAPVNLGEMGQPASHDKEHTCVFTHPSGTVAGLSSNLFLSLPAASQIGVAVEGSCSRAQGFLELSKL